MISLYLFIFIFPGAYTMKNLIKTLRISVFLICLGFVTFASASDDELEIDQDVGKRLYDFGLGKRAYRYVNEYKRLPMYNFGLGKRSKMYSFGLGKRSDLDEDEGFDDYLDDGDHITETEMYDDDSMQAPDKRAQRQYSFGLGKRPLYDFGLGKRKYDFGLGKRERLYSFGLGKRGKHMYSFGLGKREINADDLKAIAQSSAEGDNSTAPVDSHEGMGHAEKIVGKRSPRQYSFGLGKREEGDSGFPRQYRKQSYSFGLGKRRQMYSFGLGKRSEP